MENKKDISLEEFEKGCIWLETRPDTWEVGEEGETIIIDPTVPEWVRRVAEENNESMRYISECMLWWNKNHPDGY